MNRSSILKIIIVILGISNILFLSMYFFKKEEKVVDYCFYEENPEYVLVEKNVLNDLTSFLYKDNNDNYIGKIYDATSNNEITMNDLIKEDKVNLYNDKIKELLTLKYPKFIVESLLKEEVKYDYLLRENELVIYFSNYNIEPEVEELLYLKVNYNEIKDYLNFTALLDKDYQNESGYDYTLSKKSVAFTFDDSPNKNKTDKILSYLKDNHFHATFFVVGNRTINNETLLLSINSDGNEIGSHTYNHANMKKLTNEEIVNDYNKMNSIYQKLFQKDLTLLRPPYGNILNSQASLIPVSFILWNLDTNDWRYRNTNYIVNYVLDNIKDGDIILFHDSYDTTVKAIEELLPLLYSKGYQVMSVSELFKLKNVNLEKNKIYYNVS